MIMVLRYFICGVCRKRRVVLSGARSQVSWCPDSWMSLTVLYSRTSESMSHANVAMYVQVIRESSLLAYELP